jgi:hypothetical protein
LNDLDRGPKDRNKKKDQEQHGETEELEEKLHLDTSVNVMPMVFASCRSVAIVELGWARPADNSVHARARIRSALSDGPLSLIVHSQCYNPAAENRRAAGMQKGRPPDGVFIVDAHSF